MLIRKVVIGLAVVYVLTFLSGFLQETPFNFLNHLFFSLLCMGGIVLIRVTSKSETTGKTRGVLFLTGVYTILLFIFYVAYEWFRVNGNNDLEGSLEGLLYLTT